ncbi:hypothetical protein ACLOJK_021024 [Asimina triloba]
MRSLGCGGVLQQRRGWNFVDVAVRRVELVRLEGWGERCSVSRGGLCIGVRVRDLLQLILHADAGLGSGEARNGWEGGGAAATSFETDYKCKSQKS